MPLGGREMEKKLYSAKSTSQNKRENNSILSLKTLLTKKAQKNTLISLMFVLFLCTNASATIFDFGFSGLALSFDQSTGADFRFGSFSDTRSISTLDFDAVTGIADISISGLGTINDALSGAELNQTNYNFALSISGVSTNAAGDLLVSNASNGIANYTIDNASGIGQIDGSIQTFQFQTPSNLTLLSTFIGAGLRSAGWFNSINDIFINGIESNSAFTPDSSPARAAEELLAMGPGTILVTHEPLVSTVAGILSGSSQPGFSTAEMACIADGSLAWRLRN